VLVAVAVSTGLRLDELRHLRPEDVAGERVEVRAHGAWSPKSWGERTIPVGPETRELARELAAWIASTPRGVNGIALDLGGHWIASGIDAAWARAGLPGEAPRMHDARRTYATESVRLGVTLDRVRGLLGHRDVSTTERYLGRYRSDAAEVAVDVGVSGALASGAERAKVLPMRRKENG
jgi:integrase